MSPIGCKIFTHASLEPGHIITLVLYSNDGQPPITLPGTTICWGTNHRFGVRFPDMTGEERNRLKTIAQSDGLLVVS